MAAGLFVLRNDGMLVGMQQAGFASEDDFQRLLAQFPALLAGDQIDPGTPRRWMLVAREKSVAAEAGGTARWSLDHLFLDQDGVPTLVEVKRQNDTRLRREVVGQLLDYAANAVAWWSVEEVRSAFEATYANDKAVDDPLSDLIGRDGDRERFWQTVKTNLQAGRIRMLFVADLIPPELRRIVEFLNRQMDPAEVLALELRQFEGEGMRTIVPVLHGQTEAAQVKKAPGQKRQWDASSFYADLEQRAGSLAAEAARKAELWMRENTDEVWFGSGQKTGSINSIVLANSSKFYPVALWSNGQLTVTAEYNRKPPFNDLALLQNWLHRIAAAAETKVDENAGSVSLRLADLANDTRRSAVLSEIGSGISLMRKGATPEAENSQQ